MKKSIGINERIFPNPVLVLGTYDESGMPNAATFAWGGVASSNPPAISVAVRPSRYTYENLMKRKAFTASLATEEYLAEIDYFGIASGRDGNKIEKVGLTASRAEFVDAPYIEELSYTIECEVIHTLDLGAHVLFIGEIKDVKISDILIDENGKLDLSNSGFVTFDSVSGTYLKMGEVADKAFSVGLKYRT